MKYSLILLQIENIYKNKKIMKSVKFIKRKINLQVTQVITAYTILSLGNNC